MPVADLPQDLIGCSGLYNSPDPLLRRLRLVDHASAPVTNLQRAFGETDLIVLYAGSAQGSNNLTDLHRNLTGLMIKDKAATVIYVSTDVDAKIALAVAAQQPWYRMIFEDDSDFAPLAKGEPEVIEIARGEDFVPAMEIETGAEVVTYGEEEDPQDYVRPLSRAGVSITMQAYSTPSIAVYNLKTHEFVARNVRPMYFQADKIGQHLNAWRKGDALGVGFKDIADRLKWPLIALFIALLYHAYVFMNGEEANFLPKLLDQISWRSRELMGQAF
ncbi:hypothetical protein CspHIS471_0201450 [Cutaneotrichosporon sp. HIS471]|nr:hypothetical protein CspHIS471_0201450 [Cutaneotrichosporon sp. HIS471]